MSWNGLSWSRLITLLIISLVLLGSIVRGQIPPPPSPPNDDNEVFIKVEQMPYIAGCYDLPKAFGETKEQWDTRKMACQDTKIRKIVHDLLPKDVPLTPGKVSINYIIGSDGRLKSSTIVLDTTPGQDGIKIKAILDQFTAMKFFWDLGGSRGRPVNIQYTISFVL